jgi:TRAP-type transport system periplasmic protein
MKRKISLIVAMIVVGVVISAWQARQPQALAMEPQVWRHLCHVSSAKMNEYEAIKEAADRIYKQSNGALKIDVFLAGTLGFTGQEAHSAVARGFINSTLTAATHMGSDKPSLFMLGLPFIYKESKMLYKDIGGPDGAEYIPRKVVKAVTPLIEEIVTSMDLHFIGTSTRMAGLITKDKYPISKIADLKGAKMRAYSNTDADTFQALGATAVIIPYSELYTALATGVVVGTAGGAASIRDLHLWEVCKSYSWWPIAPYTEIMIINKQSYEKLPQDFRNLVDSEYLRAVQKVESLDGFVLENEYIETIKAKGMEIIQPSPSECEKGRAMMKETVWAKTLGQAGPGGQKLFDALMAAQK